MPHLSLSAVAALLHARLGAPLPGPNAQRTMAPRPHLPAWTPEARPDTARHAGALVLIYEDVAGPTIALTLRRDDLPHHPGQLSLPGGALAPGETALGAALREAEEEIGVKADAIELVGALSTVWIPVSNFVLAPFVGLCRTPPRFTPHPGEVAALVPLPLAWLTDAARIKWGQRDRDGATIDVPYFDLAPHQLWGATAMVLAELREVIRDGTGTEG